MRTAAAVATALLLAVPGRSSAQAPQTDDEKAIYALGVLIGRSVGQFNLSKHEQDLLKKGLTDQLNGQKPSVDVEAAQPRIRELEKSRVGQAAGAYLDKAAKEKGVEKSGTGLLYKSLKEGAGGSPRATDTVKVHYRGTLTNGVEFDSSYARNEPAEFPLNGVIACWTEGVQKMKVGGKARLVCPASIGYGERGSPPKIPGGATLVFEVELLDIVKK
ncbi:MAG TPA: FKBP-type peptidyl-prolyl cis-trans isomerase [Myxococcaceae bacterium]|nr:FKBP-type peptidyl-prolyl cis-trans isomerase [Myxococcaceae bacterium]